jgi:hypothetical protein
VGKEEEEEEQEENKKMRNWSMARDRAPRDGTAYSEGREDQQNHLQSSLYRMGIKIGLTVV